MCCTRDTPTSVLEQNKKKRSAISWAQPLRARALHTPSSEEAHWHQEGRFYEHKQDPHELSVTLFIEEPTNPHGATKLKKQGTKLPSLRLLLRLSVQGEGSRASSRILRL